MKKTIIIFSLLFTSLVSAVSKKDLDGIDLEILIEDTRIEESAKPWIHIGQAPYVFWSTMWESHSYCYLKAVNDNAKNYSCLIEDINLKRLITSSVSKPYDIALLHKIPGNTGAKRTLCDDMRFSIDDIDVKCSGFIFKKCKATIKIDHCQFSK